MDDELVRREPSRTTTPHGRRYRPHALELADGGRLVLGVDGTIVRTDALGARKHAWTTDDPEWPSQAIRFGLHPEASTVTPQGRSVPGSKPPR